MPNPEFYRSKAKARLNPAPPLNRFMFCPQIFLSTLLKQMYNPTTTIKPSLFQQYHLTTCTKIIGTQAINVNARRQFPGIEDNFMATYLPESFR